MVLKDFFWWLLKENFIINLFYRYLFPIFWKESCKIDLELSIINKSDIKGFKPQSSFFIKGYTSGTTNTPLTVYRSIQSILAEEYYFKRYLWSFGLGLSPKIAVLRGDNILHASDTKSKPYKKMPFSGRLIFSSFHINALSVRDYLDALERFQPDVIHAYPSSIALLAGFAKQLNWEPTWSLKCIVTSSESFKKEDFELVKSVFQKVGDYYGQAERVAALELCKNGKYHPVEGYSVMEFIPSEYGHRIVGSNIHNKVMKLKRYDTGDFVELSPVQTCDCGRDGPVIERIVGRSDDFIVTSNGTKIGRLDVAFKNVNGIARAQIQQTEIGAVRVVILLLDVSEKEVVKKVIMKNLAERLGDNFKIEFSFEKSEFIYGKTGKFKSVVSEIK